MANADQKREVGTNVMTRVEGRKLIIEIDLDHRAGQSASGKSLTIASTQGIKQVPGGSGARYGVNVFLPVAS